MEVLLPPCVEALMERVRTREDERALVVVASYFKGHVPRHTMYRTFPEVANKIMEAINKREIPPFSCRLVSTMGFEHLCDSARCPFLAQTDAVSFVLTNAKRITYNPLTKELKFYFPNVRSPMVVPTRGAVANRNEVMGDMNAYALEAFGVFLQLKPYRDEDGVRHDPLQELIMLAFKQAETVMEDEEGVAEALTHIITMYSIVPHEEATALSDGFVYTDPHGNRFLAISASVMRSVAHSFLGIRSIRRLKELLEKYGIVKRRIRIHGERAYFYLVPEAVVRSLLDTSLEGILMGEMDEWQDVMSTGIKGGKN